MSDQASLQESAQALFCALGEYINIKSNSVDFYFDKKEHPTFLKFEESWNKDFKNKNESIESIYIKFTKTASGSKNIDYADIKDFIVTKNDWYKSSISIADKFIKDVDKQVGLKAFKGKPSLNDIWFYRGDSEVMLNIAELYRLANKNASSKFGDINKWCPADIYFSEEEAKKEITKSLNYYEKNLSQYGFDILNNMISNLISKGQLLPISLKKQTGTVQIKTVNFNKVKEEQEILTYKFNGLRQKWNPSTRKKPETRDLQILYSSDTKPYLQFRHDPSNGELADGFKCEALGGGEAKGGGLSSIRVFTELFSKIDKSAAEEFNRIWKKGSDNFRKIMKPKRAKLNNDLKKSKSPAAQKIIKDAYDEDRGFESAKHVTNPAFIFLIDWLNTNDQSMKNNSSIVNPSDRMMQKLFVYITSRSEMSSKFIIMK
jgi:hypothetical protein